MPRTKYVVLHNHPEKLVMSQQHRDLIFSTGNVLSVRECAIHSLQREFFQTVAYRPLTLILWGMADRYGVAETTGVEILMAKDWSEVYAFCQHQRAEALTRQPDGSPGAVRWSITGDLSDIPVSVGE